MGFPSGASWHHAAGVLLFPEALLRLRETGEEVPAAEDHVMSAEVLSIVSTQTRNF